jgi:hypothetical protein
MFRHFSRLSHHFPILRTRIGSSFSSVCIFRTRMSISLIPSLVMVSHAGYVIENSIISSTSIALFSEFPSSQSNRSKSVLRYDKLVHLILHSYGDYCTTSWSSSLLCRLLDLLLLSVSVLGLLYHQGLQGRRLSVNIQFCSFLCNDVCETSNELLSRQRL